MPLYGTLSLFRTSLPVAMRFHPSCSAVTSALASPMACLSEFKKLGTVRITCATGSDTHRAHGIKKRVRHRVTTLKALVTTFSVEIVSCQLLLFSFLFS